jgi:hypothetical protein
LHVLKGFVIKFEDCIQNSADIFHLIAMLVLMTENGNRVASSGMMSVLNAMKMSLKLLVHVTHRPHM